jgi:hypothetical protein
MYRAIEVCILVNAWARELAVHARDDAEADNAYEPTLGVEYGSTGVPSDLSRVVLEP